MYDICVIGAGVVGTNIARELAKYELKVCVIEKLGDVGCGCSKANSGIVHGGYSDEPGTIKAELCVKGNRMYEQMEKELNFGYRKTGSFVLAFNEEENEKLDEIYHKGIKNGVEGLEIIDGDKARQMEPHLSEAVTKALYCENAGVTSPYEFVIALAENAIANGVEIKLNSEVTKIVQKEEYFEVEINQKEIIKSQYVINSAGIYSDAIAKMAGIDEYDIHASRGQYIILDKTQNNLANAVIFQVPTKLGKGILVTSTYHGNLLIGPNAEEINDKEDLSTDEDALIHIAELAKKSVPEISLKRALKSFAGNRPKSNKKDWIIEESRVKRFINLIGIDSPGLTSSPAIALKVVEILKVSGLNLLPKTEFRSYRAPIIKKKTADFKGSIDSKDPNLHIICRCESVTEAEIMDALHRGLPVNTLDGVARRTRAGFGPCQGAFCGPRVRKILARELNVEPDEIKGRVNRFEEIVTRVKRLDITKIH